MTTGGASRTREVLIAFRDVALGYGQRPVVESLSFEVCAGDFVGIVGPNGVGKTTMLRGILGLMQPIRGEIVLHGSAGRDALNFGYVPQRETVDDRYPLTVAEVVLMGRYRRVGLIRRPTSQDSSQAEAAMELCGITAQRHHLMRDLSGGQRQRALIARALAGEPDLLVLDEPVSGLDLKGNAALMQLISGLHESTGLSIIMVSHQLNTIANWVSHVGLLHAGHLRIGPRDEILTSAALTEVYGEGAGVVEVDGRRVVLPPTDAR